ncbi:hypothetical protein [Stutzerimonas azotifigens]|uniref:hypothetical protein n=1 Tax=Stutzerimonas azotifigens TaxID=291995 RepID=UPI00040020B9|nr:hypothetical protein [Stutzerimonas azotifigens]
MTATTHSTRVDYFYQQDPREHLVESDGPLSPGQAARLLIERHFADAENNLVLPEADASEDELLRQAEILGITRIRLHDQG